MFIDTEQTHIRFVLFRSRKSEWHIMSMSEHLRRHQSARSTHATQADDDEKWERVTAEKKNANERTKDKQRIIDENRREWMEMRPPKPVPPRPSIHILCFLLRSLYPVTLFARSCQQFIVDPSIRLCAIYIVPSHFIVCSRPRCVRSLHRGEWLAFIWRAMEKW